MADLNSYAKAFQRARKAYAHASRQSLETASDKARRRHARRAFNACRAMKEAQTFYEEIALFEMESDA